MMLWRSLESLSAETRPRGETQAGGAGARLLTGIAAPGIRGVWPDSLCLFVLPLKFSLWLVFDLRKRFRDHFNRKRAGQKVQRTRHNQTLNQLAKSVVETAQMALRLAAERG